MPWKRHNPEAVYRFVVEYKLSHDGNSPTLREIGDGCGISSTYVVSSVLERLDRAGRIEFRADGRSRAIEVVGGKWKPPPDLPQVGGGILASHLQEG